MDNYVGTIIKKLRLEKNMTQKELSVNICTLKQLYRIEKNISNPSAYILCRVSSRLGNSLIEYLPYSDCMYGYDVKNEIDILLELFNHHEHRKIMKLIKKSKIFPKTTSIYAKQEIAWIEGAINHYIKTDINVNEIYYINILKKSHNFKNILNIFDEPLNTLDFKILNSLIVIYLKKENFEFAKTLLDLSIKNFEKNYNKITDTSYVRLIYNLSRLYYYQKKYLKAIFLAEKGINHCIKNNNISYLADLYNIAGRSYIKSGNNIKGKKLLSFYEKLRIIYKPDIPYIDTLRTLHETYGDF